MMKIFQSLSWLCRKEAGRYFICIRNFHVSSIMFTKCANFFFSFVVGKLDYICVDIARSGS